MQQMSEAPRSTELYAISFDKFLRKKAPLRSDAPVFDLRWVTLITPAVLVQLAAWSYALAQDGRRVLIETDKESVRAYLMRSGRSNPLFFRISGIYEGATTALNARSSGSNRCGGSGKKVVVFLSDATPRMVCR